MNGPYFRTVHPPSWAASGRDAMVFEVGRVYHLASGYIACTRLIDYADAAEQIAGQEEPTDGPNLVAAIGFVQSHPHCSRTYDLRGGVQPPRRCVAATVVDEVQ